MAHHKSALKRIRQSRKLKIYNRQNKKAIKLAVRGVKEAENFEIAVEKLKTAQRIFDKAVYRNIVHKNNAANHVAALSHYVTSLKKQDA